jgi:hypothetical protein
MLNREKLRSSVSMRDVRPVPAPWLLTVVLMAACPDDKGTPTATDGPMDDTSTDGSTTPTSSSTTSTDESSSTTVDDTLAETTIDASSTTADEPVGDTTGATGDGATSTGTTSADTTSTTTDASTGGSGSLPQACQVLCEKAVGECDVGFPGDSVTLCTNSCIANFAEDVGACAEAAIVYLDCVAGLDCAGLTDALVMGEYGDCLDAAAAYQAACN